MEFEKLSELTMEQKKEILSSLIINDVSYWKKIMILMSMIDESEDTEMLDLIIEHKIEETNLAKRKYNLSLKSKKIEKEDKGYGSVIKKILEGSNDVNYSQACKEAVEILKYIPEEYYNRINKKLIERLESDADESYNLIITPDAKFESLNILNETKEILSLLSDKFWKQDGKNIKIDEIFNKK